MNVFEVSHVDDQIEANVAQCGSVAAGLPVIVDHFMKWFSVLMNLA
jgi:hypothetical protein